MKIYKIKINQNFDKKLINNLTKFISKEKYERIKRFKFKEDFMRSLLGDLLYRYAICKKLRCKNNELEFAINEYNKPYILCSEDLHFNISHSGDWVVCALSDKFIGIDVERIKSIDLDIAKNYFTIEEYESILEQPIENRLKFFYYLWTLKESYVKADGRGLLLDFKTFSIHIRNNEIVINTNNKLKSCFFKTYNIEESYIISICSLNSKISDIVEEISICDILETI